MSFSASSQLISKISKLFKCAFVQAFCDVTLACDGGSIKCHKMVLAASSPYFHKLFMETSCDHPIVFLKVCSTIIVLISKNFLKIIMLEIVPDMPLAENNWHYLQFYHFTSQFLVEISWLILYYKSNHRKVIAFLLRIGCCK